MSAFARLAIIDASTKRTPAISGGKRSDPVLYLTNLYCTPLDPIDSELALRAGLDSPVHKLQTMIHGDVDIVEGDTLTVGGKDYPIASCLKWQWRGESFLQLIVEDVKA